MSSLVTPQDFDAVLFDLDGVLTTTRTVHAAAWKRTFDEFLSAWDAANGTTTPRFDERPGLRVPRRRQAPPGRGPGLPGLPRHRAPGGGHAGLPTRRGVGLGPRQPEATAGRGGAGTRGGRGLPRLGRLGPGAARGRAQDGRRVEQPQLRRRARAGRDQQPLRRRRRRRDRARARPARQACARRVPGGAPGGSACHPGRGGRRRGRPRRRGGRPGRRVRTGDRRRPRRAGRRRWRRTVPTSWSPTSGELLADAARTSTAPVRERTGCWQRPGGSWPRPATTRSTRGGSSSAPTTPTTSSRPRRCSPCRTDTSACGAPSRRASPRTSRCTLLNGFHETWPIVYPEAAHGFATTGQTILPVPDGTDDPAVRRRGARHLRDHRGAEYFERVLDMQRAVLGSDRRVPAGRRPAVAGRQRTVRIAGAAAPGLHPL